MSRLEQEDQNGTTPGEERGAFGDGDCDGAAAGASGSQPEDASEAQVVELRLGRMSRARRVPRRRAALDGQGRAVRVDFGRPEGVDGHGSQELLEVPRVEPVDGPLPDVAGEVEAP